MALSLLILDQNQTVRNPYFFIMGRNDLNKTSHAAVSLKGQKRGIIFLKILSFPLRCFRISCKFVWYSTRLTQVCMCSMPISVGAYNFSTYCIFIPKSLILPFLLPSYSSLFSYRPFIFSFQAFHAFS